MSADTPKPDLDVALGFLQRYYREGEEWRLSAFDKDRKQQSHGGTRVFKEIAPARAWIMQMNGQRWNIYFSVNQALPGVEPRKRLSKELIGSVTHLHVDVDPREGEDHVAERARILALLTDRRPASIPAPTVIIDSGGGYQAFWRLREPAAVPDLAAAEELELHNIRLGADLTGDNTHDVSRVMRVPGTVNWPDARKRAKNRVPCLAALVDFSDAEYTLGDIPKATKSEPEELPRKKGRRVSAPAADAGDDVPEELEPESIASLDELAQWGTLPETVRVAIIHGRDAANPKDHDDSRSSWLFHVTCALCRMGVPDEVVLGIIMNPDLRISESVLALGRSARKYALKQLKSAKAAAKDDNLRRVNEQYFVVQDEGSKCRVAFWRGRQYEKRQKPRQELVFQSFADFRNAHMNELVKSGTPDDPKFAPLGDWWLRHRMRRQFRQVDFLPGGQTDHDVYNLWRGFAVEPRKGSCRRILRHIFEVLACRNRLHFRYIIYWMAWGVQNPGEQAEVAIVFRGKKGSGKGTVGRWYCFVFGQHGLQVFSTKHVSGKFNAHLRDCVVLFADEAIAPGDRDGESVLKGLITEPLLVIEGKGRDIVTGPNHLHVIMASNEEWVVPAGPDERRFAVFNVSEERVGDFAYFAAIEDEMESGGAEALLHFLQHVPLGDWHPRRAIPQNEALRQQKLQTVARMRPCERLWLDYLREGELPLGQELGDGTVRISSSHFVKAMNRETKSREDISPKMLASLAARLGFRKHNDPRPRGWVVPRLQVARAAWVAAGLPADWPEDDQLEWQALGAIDGDPNSDLR